MSSTTDGAQALGATTSRQAQLAITEELDAFMDDVHRLAQYAVETGRFPDDVDVGTLYAVQRKYRDGGGLDSLEFTAVVDAYQELERLLGPTTAETLKATEDVRADMASEEKARSAAGRFVLTLRRRTYINLGLILLAHVVAYPLLWVGRSAVPPDDDPNPLLDMVGGWLGDPNGWWPWLGVVVAVLGLISTYVIPFLYGALGADAYVLRRTTHKLAQRQFDPRQIPEYKSRFLLGTVSGGVIVLFVSTESFGVGTSAFGDLGAAAIGFLAGYSNEFLFATIERIIAAVLPRMDRPAADHREQAQASQLSEEERVALRERFGHGPAAERERRGASVGAARGDPLPKGAPESPDLSEVDERTSAAGSSTPPSH